MLVPFEYRRYFYTFLVLWALLDFNKNTLTSRISSNEHHRRFIGYRFQMTSNNSMVTDNSSSLYYPALGTDL